MSENSEFSLVRGEEVGNLAVITSEQREILGLSSEWPRAVLRPWNAWNTNWLRYKFKIIHEFLFNFLNTSYH